MLKKVFKYLLIVVLIPVALVMNYLFLAWILSRLPVPREAIRGDDVTIYIKTNGVHTDIVVPVVNEWVDWSREIRFENTTSKDAAVHYLGMGWGDKGFYLETPEWSDLKFRIAFNAAFGRGSTAIHATFYKEMTEGANCKRISISKTEYQRLVWYIWNSFEKDEKGHVMLIETHSQYGEYDAFYEATGSYSMFTTCNSWANTALMLSGQRCCMWTPFDTGIFLKYP